MQLALALSEPFPSGLKAKAQDIINAIRTLKKVEQENRPANLEEKKVLVRFGGFGPVALTIFPDPVTGQYKDGWESTGEELKALLTPEEYDSAKRTTFNAFYTSPAVMSSMHEALARLGVPAGATVLEPGCGVGRFISLAPAGQHFIGVELDSISGRISKVLHPQADIRIENFRDTKLPALDAVIGNVPFADVKMDHHGQKFSLHDYFFAKSIDALKPGGVLALVTSHYTLDKQNAAIREYIGDRADFLGAIRLPSDAFKREGTSVVTDIVFLRKRAPGEPARHQEAEWHRSRPFDIDGVELPINRYFVRHPEMVLGTWSRKDTLYGEGYGINSNGDLAAQLREAVGRLPRFEPLQSESQKPNPSPDIGKTISAFTPPPPLPHISEGSFFVSDEGTICQSINGQSEPVIYGGTLLKSHGTMTGRRIAALIGLRDKARRVLQSQNEDWPEAHRIEARKQLNWGYERFEATYGPINKTTTSETADGTTIRRMPNIVKFREDPDAMLVLSLEEYDDATGTATKSAIMKRDVVGRNPPVTRVKSAEEGLLVSLDRKGAVDLPFISQLYGKPEEKIISELGDLIYHDPDAKEWQTADAYLSGNVRAKLAAAEKAGAIRNADALRKVQPEDVLPGDIDANLGAPWIPTTDIRDFAADLFQVPADNITIEHLKKDAVWSLDAGYAAQQSVAATSEVGTSRANGTTLLELAMNMKSPTIYDPDPNDPDKRVVNQEQTLAAREKQKVIKERFRAWVFADPDRTERLVRIYNDTYNNLRPRLFDGSHLDFPGMNKTIILNSHQKAAVWRVMSSGNTLLAHCVGAGKSFEMAAAAMKLRQTGLARRSILVVPNHLLEDFGREFMRLYPNAKLLIAGKEDFSKDRRKLLTAKIASGDWDGIIVTHSGFEHIGMSKEYQAEFLREQIAEYDQLLVEAAASKGSRRNLTKNIEKQKAAREEKLKDLLAEDKKDTGLVFDELGVDHLFADEFQYVKNLETPTKMDRVAGIQTGGSERAFDMYMKSRYLHQQHPGHGLTAATGTPISNSLVEMYTLQRFLDPEGLRSRGIDHFDAWAATFGEVVESMEISPDGKTLKPRARFSKFVNLPELQQMFRAFADVQTADMLNLPRPALEGGKPHIVACPMSDQQYAIQQELVERYDRLRSSKVDPRVDNALAITTDGRKLALDARMLDAAAPDFPESKINALVQNTFAIWERSTPTRGTQLVFCDMGVHPTPWGFSAYDEIIRKLIGRGIPAQQIAVMGDADSDAKKRVLFDKVRSGQIRILLGSTQKMGTGTNVQKRLVALHHLDAPWKPAEVEQREGRILRQGNENPEVAIYRYVTEGSFDAYMWQALEVKARFINQIMTGQNGLRKAEDIGGQELSYAEVKALASGNPAFLTLAEADAEVQRLNLLKRTHFDEQYTARLRTKELPGTIKRMKDRVTALTADMATVKANEGIAIGNRACSHEDALVFLGHRLDKLPLSVSERHPMPLGTYRGLKFGVVLGPFGMDVYLEGQITRHHTLSRDHHGPRAVMNALERLASGYGLECERTRQDLQVMEKQLADYGARLGRVFEHEVYLKQLAELRDRLKMALSAHQEVEGEPTVAELAEQIKKMKAGHAAEPQPERTASRQLSAEEPVQARIRRLAQEAVGPEEEDGAGDEQHCHVDRVAREPQSANGRR